MEDVADCQLATAGWCNFACCRHARRLRADRWGCTATGRACPVGAPDEETAERWTTVSLAARAQRDEDAARRRQLVGR